MLRVFLKKLFNGKDSACRLKVIKAAEYYIGIVGKGASKHIELVNKYNTLNPLPRGYKLTYNDSYCAAGVTVFFMDAGLTGLITPECGVEEMRQGAELTDTWVADKNYIPDPGDIIVFRWATLSEMLSNDDNGQHVVLVKSVEGNVIRTINPNCDGGQTKYYDFYLGDESIRGYITPKY